MSMLIQQKIAMGLVREGYALNGNDVEKAVQALWPNAIFPLELWCKAHEIYWQGFADSNWCEVDKTQTGRLLSTKKFKEDKTYRNRVDKLLEKAASFDIIKA